MSDTPTILEFDRVTASAPDGPVFARERALILRAGELGVVRIDPGLSPAWLADLAQGLLEPESGVVRYQGRPWAEYPAPEALAARGMRIGRIFSDSAFLGNLDLDENIALAARHHGLRPDRDLEDAARALAARLGLASTPIARPAWAAPRDREAAQWIRATLNDPPLVLVEAAGLRVPDLTAAGAAVLDDLRRRGAATLWIAAWDAPPPPGPAPAWEQTWQPDGSSKGPA